MPKIILASRSKARQKLLRQIGLRFITAESSAEESRLIKTDCRGLVIGNALKKARDVAKRYNSGIVIGADTAVLVGGRLIGKPSNMKDAHRTLRLLSKKPQWVYSGIAVINIDTGRTFTDYAKTKVYMHRLSGKDITNYFKSVSPLDKAGSFDIQGRGGLFVERIEGCFYNVVGLPLAKLAKLLKKAGIDVFLTK